MRGWNLQMSSTGYLASVLTTTSSLEWAVVATSGYRSKYGYAAGSEQAHKRQD